MIKLNITLYLILFSSLAIAQEADAILGEWYSENQNFVFKIEQNNKGRYEGTIISSKDPDRTDKYGKPLVGMTTLTNLKYTSKGRYVQGLIYAPKRGRTFDTEAKLHKINNEVERLEVTVSAGFVTRQQVWTRKKDR